MNKKKFIMGATLLSIFLLCTAISIRFISVPFAQRNAQSYFEVNQTNYQKMANGMDYWIDKKMGREHFNTGSQRFDGEWLFGTYLMTAIGYTQEALIFPEMRDQHIEKIRSALKAIQSENIQKFDVEAWGENPLAFKASDHAAYLGYYNLALSLYHMLLKNEPNKEKDELVILNTKITKFLKKRLTLSPLKLLESYPKEVYSVDNCAVISSISVFNKAINMPEDKIVTRWFDTCRKVCMDPKTGTLIQALHWQDGSLVEYPRASGTFLGIYFLSFANPEFAKELYMNSKKEFFTTVLGLGAVREYTRDVPSGLGDIDSGPVVFGFGLSPIGFMIGCARIFDDKETFHSLFGTCYIGGAAVENQNRYNWSTGGSIGDAVMFGMLTTIKRQDWENLK